MHDASPNHANSRATLRGVDHPEPDSALNDIQQHEAHDLYLDGVAAALKGKRTAAERLLLAAVALDPQLHQAWLWLAGVVDSPQRSIEYLERVLMVVPGEPHALEGLEWAGRKLSLQAPTATDTAPALPVPERVAPQLVAADPAADRPVATGPRLAAAPKNATHARRKAALELVFGVAALACGLLICIWALSHYVGELIGPVPGGEAGLPVVSNAAGIPTGTAPGVASDTASPFVAPAMVTLPPSRPVIELAWAAPLTPTVAPLESPTAAKPTTAKPVASAVGPSQPIRSVPTAPSLPSLDRQQTAVVVTMAVASATPTQPVQSLTPGFRPPWHPNPSLMGALRANWQAPGTLWKDNVRRAGKWIEVDLGAQALRAYADGELVLEAVVSTGLKQTPTMTGEYRIISKYRLIDMYGPGYYLRGVPYVMYFHGAYAIHGANWHNNFGRRASHGCINMKVEDAKRLFEWADPKLAKGGRSILAGKNNLGTVVTIHD